MTVAPAPTPEPKFAVWCEAKDFDHPLVMHDLSFAKLIDEIVVPYEKDEPFFVDGVPLTKTKIRRLKILQQRGGFARLFADLHAGLRAGSDAQKKLLADQYHVRFEAALREGCDDVTAQAIRAYNTEIKPKLKAYLPNRKELIDAALKVFVEGVKFLAAR